MKYLFILSLSFLSFSAFSVEPGTYSFEKRLIEVTPGEKLWVTPEQMQDRIEKTHEAGHCGGFFDVTDHPESTYSKEFIPAQAYFHDELTPAFETTVEKVLPELSADNLHGTVSKLSSFPNRYFMSESGKQSAQWIFEQFQQMSASRTDVTVELKQHKWKQPSVIAQIQGSEKPEEIIVLGAHQDSINKWTPFMGWKAPGADDDASGVATIMEVFRVLMDSGYKPKRSIQFIAYAGEELGLLGSQDIARSYSKAKKQVVAAIQFDMTMYPGKAHKITLISDYVDPGLTTFIAKIIDKYVHFPWQSGKCGYPCSDHASWQRSGFSAAFPFEALFEESNPNVHTRKDTVDILDPEYGLHFAKIGLAFAIELGERS